ncbi:MAG: phosphatase PAP2 family protein [Bacillota bacterium]|nr:phosphatase PAP2 family protein [Bacillota bacterium]
MELISKIDYGVFNFIDNYIRNDLLDFFMIKISSLGNSGFIWICFAAAFLINKKYRKAGYILSIGLLTYLIFGELILKNVIARNRPDFASAFNVKIPKSYSFPSGHTTSSVLSFLIISKYIKKLRFIVIPLGILISISRFYIGVHYFSDVVGGVILGLIIYYIALYIGHKFGLDQ